MATEAAILLVAAFVVGVLAWLSVQAVLSRRKRHKRQRRRIRNIAYERAWNLVYARRRHLRLTDGRAGPDR